MNMKHFTLALVALATICTAASAQKLKNVYASNSRINIEQLQQADQPVQLNRILFAGYNTICLPMTLSADQLQKAAPDVQVERFVGIRQEGAVLNLIFQDCTAEGIQAGTPYLIYSPTLQYLRARNNESMAIDNQLQPVVMTDQLGNRVTFTSSWEQFSGDGRYGIPAKQETDMLQSILVRTQSEQRFLPTRCGFVWNQSASATELKIKHVTEFNDVQTDIQSLKEQNALVDVYDLTGNLVRAQVRINAALSSLPAGIYVIGGEKVAVK